MILQTVDNDITNNLDGNSEHFSIEASAKMFDLLSSKIYANPIRAIIRELCCNAIDAHIDIGNVAPIHVYLPTAHEKSLTIQDFGIGMTHEDVMSVYKTYGKSTKSSSNKPIGALGLGGKTPLAYTHQFTLTTARDGIKNSYLIFRNESGIPEITQLNSEPCDESGTSINLLVKEADISAFIEAAYITFIFFDTIPIIKRGEESFYETYWKSDVNLKKLYLELHDYILNNNKLFFKFDDLKDTLLKFIVDKYSTQYGVIMNQVFYTVDKQKLHSTKSFESITEVALRYPCSTDRTFFKIIKVDPGSVSFQPSRESLNYSNQTLELLVSLFSEEFKNYVSNINSLKGPQDLIDNIEKVDHRIVDELFLRKKSSDNTFTKDVIQFIDNYSTAVDYFFEQSKFDLLFFFDRDQYSRNKRLYYQQLLYLDFHSKSQIFKNIFTNKYRAMLELDNNDFYLKFIEKWSERKEKKQTNFVPAFISKYIDNISYNDILVQKSFSSYFKDNSGLPQFSFNKEKTAYDLDNKEIVEEKIRAKKNLDGKCFDDATGLMISIDDVMELLKKEEVSYRLFEGEYRNRGYYYEPDFTSIGAKNTSIKETYNSSWIPTKDDHIPMPKHQLFVDYSFFKKNELWTLQNLYFHKDYAIKQLVPYIVGVKKELENPVIYNNYPFDEVSNSFLSFGSKLYQGFDTTYFGKKYIEYCSERSAKETDFDNFEYKLNMIKHHYLLKRGDHLIQQYSELAKKIKDSIDILLETTRIKKKGINREDHITEFNKRYPMLVYLSGKIVKHFYNYKNIADYVALVDGLKSIQEV